MFPIQFYKPTHPKILYSNISQNFDYRTAGIMKITISRNFYNYTKNWLAVAVIETEMEKDNLHQRELLRARPSQNELSVWSTWSLDSFSGCVDCLFHFLGVQTVYQVFYTAIWVSIYSASCSDQLSQQSVISVQKLLLGIQNVSPAVKTGCLRA